MPRASRVGTVALLVLVMAFCLGCPGQSAGRRGTTVLYASGADLQSINPLLAVHPLAKAVQKHILLMTLASYDTAFRVVPRLAAWEWNERRDAMLFSMRRDVFWHDGVQTTARDVVFTLDMARNTNVGYPRIRDLTGIRDVVSVDSFSVRVTFSRRQPTFPDVFTDLAILPAHHFDGIAPAGIRSAPFNRTPVGNGPFRFVEHRTNQRWVFERSDVLPRPLGRPMVDRFIVVIVDEATTKLAALTSGELDFAGISPAHASFVRADTRLHVIDYPIQFVYALVWNVRRRPFDDVRVRQALTMALDRPLLVDAFLYGFGTTADGPVSPNHPWYLPLEPTRVDRNRAASILDEAGMTPDQDGVRLRIDLLTVQGDAALEQMVQAQLAAIGVEVRIRQLELSTFLARAQSADRDFDVLALGIPGDFSLGYIQAMFDGTDPGPLAYPGFRDARLDGAFRRIRGAETAEALRRGWHDVQRLLAETHPTTWLYHARGLQGASRRIVNTQIDLRGELATIADWRFVDEETER